MQKLIKFKPIKPLLTGETLDTLTAAVVEAGFPAFRALQVMEWVYKQYVTAWEEMVNVPRALKEWLESRYTLQASSLVLVKGASDVTEKHLLRQGDGSLIETVLIRYPQRGVGAEESRKTICVSSQVGCAYGCKFCASGLDGWKRHLFAGEIVDQVLHICRAEATREADGVPFDNIVFMGMGEPLANYDNVMRAITILNAPWGLHFGGRRITVSTSGLVPEILKLAEEPVSFRLAISLHGATNPVRDKIMPVNRKYPLEILLPAVKAFAEKRGRMITLEYILIDGINDGLDQAEILSKIAKDLHAHVNLIPYNKVEGLRWVRPNIMRQTAFHDVLKAAGASSTIRKEKGHDIAAACGQLRLQVQKEEATVIEESPLAT